MAFVTLKKAQQINVRLNGTCSYNGKEGTVIAFSDIGKQISGDTLTVVRLKDTKMPVRVRVLCFGNKQEVISHLNQLFG